MYSIYEVLFSSEVTVASIYFVLLVAYDAFQERKEHLTTRQLLLLAFTLLWMIASIGALSIALFFLNYFPSSLTEFSTAWALGSFTFLVWFSTFLVLAQGLLIYKKLVSRSRMRMLHQVGELS